MNLYPVMSEAYDCLPLDPYQKLEGEIISIPDGDTIHVLLKSPNFMNKKVKVRLLHIDAPEIDFRGFSQNLDSPNMKYADQARDHLRSLLPIQSKVTLELEKKPKDSYCRLLAIVIKENFNQEKIELNYEMLKSGYAMTLFYDPASPRFEIYSAVIEKHRQEKTGLFFGDSHVQIPLQFRQSITYNQ